MRPTMGPQPYHGNSQAFGLNVSSVMLSLLSRA